MFNNKINKYVDRKNMFLNYTKIKRLFRRELSNHNFFFTKFDSSVKQNELLK